LSEADREDEVDEAWLLARERGQHASTASSAIAVRYAEVEAAIAELPATPAGAEPPPDWQQRILAAIDAAEGATPATDGQPAVGAIAKRRPAAWRRWAGPAGAAAMAACLALVLYSSRAQDDARDGDIAFEVQPASGTNRGAEPSVGGALIVRGLVDGPGELRVYNAAGVEQARCAVTAPDCEIDRSGKHTGLRLTVPLRVSGPMRAVLFSSPLAGSSLGMARDVEAAERGGIRVTSKEKRVR